jgi:hypothetical protein
MVEWLAHTFIDALIVTAAVQYYLEQFTISIPPGMVYNVPLQINQLST